MLPPQAVSTKAITSQPKVNHINAISDLSNHSDSIHMISTESNFLDDTLTTETSPTLENGDAFSNGSQDSYGGSTNHAFIGEEESVTPRPHKMNYTCAHPEACTKCNSSTSIGKIDEETETRELTLAPLPEVIEHEVTIVTKHPMTSAPGKALRKLDPRKLNLTLDLFSSRTKKKEKNKSNNSSNNSSLSPKSSSPFSTQVATENVSELLGNLKCIPPTELQNNSLPLAKLSDKAKTVDLQTTPKTSWLLRLFESQVSTKFYSAVFMVLCDLIWVCHKLSCCDQMFCSLSNLKT